MTLRTIDPFGYWPAFRSRITGLGGETDPTDLSYVFHSPYTPLEPGPSVAMVAFDRLRARTGLLEVSVFQLHAAHTPPVSQAGKTGALLTTIARADRPIRLPFEAIAGAQYAVIGLAFGECEARARGLTIEIGARSIEDDLARQRSEFGRMKARRVVGLASVQRPSLRTPVSQGFSIAQTEEEDFARWATWLDAHDPAETRWEAAYILRVLEAYGRLEPGARGLGLARDADPLAAIAENVGCSAIEVTMRPDEKLLDALDRTEAGSGYDFLWTRSGVLAGLDTTRAISVIGGLLERVRPGGLTVHMLAADDSGLDGALDTNALNRIALGLVADGHIVAQLRHDHHRETKKTARRAGPVPFGIVIRRATAAD